MDYDVIVLGGGSAGTAAASAASLAGARTLMINDGELGGLCILRGCMPTKTLLASAHALHETTTMGELGVSLEGRAVPDFAQIMQRKDRLVARFKRAKVEGIERGDYELLDARGRFDADGGIEADGRTLRAKAYVIATGSRANSLPIPGIDEVPVWDSDDVMQLTRRPERLLVQGAGPIGLELAQFFARMGTEVVLVNRSPLLSHDDSEQGAILAEAFAAEPRLTILAPSQICGLRARKDGLTAAIVGHDDFDADALLMATGRSAALEGLGLEAAGIELRNGRVVHDENLRTSAPNVYVAGDATGSFQILHLANQEGEIAGFNAASGESPRVMDYRLKMSVIFTDPPFARVGIDEAEAARRGIEIAVGRARFPETGRAITMGVQHGMWKLFVDRANGEILGANILGPRADDLIHLIALLMYRRGNIDDIFELPWYHPTLSEVMLDIGRSARRAMSTS